MALVGRQCLRLLGVAGLVFTLTPAPPAIAAPIEYTVTNMGGDLWQYEYFADMNSWTQFEGFQVYFDFTSSSDLIDQSQPAAGLAGWETFVSQPDPFFFADGIFDAYAIGASPDGAADFFVSFLWSGPNPPASQAYITYFDDLTTFEMHEAGQTVLRSPVSVPEPGTLALLATGLAMTALRRRGRRNRLREHLPV